MRIISWNVNGIRAVYKKNYLLPLLEEYSPDVFLLQEIKGNVDQFPEEIVNPPEYISFFNSAEKKGYSGTSVWLKHSFVENLDQKGDVINFDTVLPGDPCPEEGRLVRADFSLNGKEYTILGIYFPNGGKSEEAWQGKLVFYEALLDYVNSIQGQGRICIWAGDVNCAHNEIDLALPKENNGKIGFHPSERAWIDKCISNSWIDIFRLKYPEAEKVYSWWHMVTRARERNVGWRIDYFFCHSDFTSRINEIQYLTDYQGSDHCPILLDFKT